jgi:hypothetical protein
MCREMADSVCNCSSILEWAKAKWNETKDEGIGQNRLTMLPFLLPPKNSKFDHAGWAWKSWEKSATIQ